MKKEYSPIAVAIALSLYSFNVSAFDRGKKLYEHFEGDCMGLDDLTTLLLDQKGIESTELPFPTADVYVEHALEKYGEEAEDRATLERAAFERFKAAYPATSCRS